MGDDELIILKELQSEFALKKDLDNINEELSEIKQMLKIIQGQLSKVVTTNEIKGKIANERNVEKNNNTEEILKMADSITKALKVASNTSTSYYDNEGIRLLLNTLGLPVTPNTQSQKDELKKLHDLLNSFDQQKENGHSEEISNVVGMLVGIMSTKKERGNK